MPLAAIELIRDLCWLIYAGAIVANSFYPMFAAKEKRQQQLDSFLNLGSVLGLSLGGAIFSAIIIRWLTIAHFYPITPVETLAFGVGFGLWLSNMILEIWAPRRDYFAFAWRLWVSGLFGSFLGLP